MTGCPVEEVKQKSAAVPLRGIVCGPPGALSCRVSVALRALPEPHDAACTGANVT